MNVVVGSTLPAAEPATALATENAPVARSAGFSTVTTTAASAAATTGFGVITGVPQATPATCGGVSSPNVIAAPTGMSAKAADSPAFSRTWPDAAG